MIGEWTNKLAELIKEFFHLFKFWTVVNVFEEVVILRLGQFNRVLKPGIHWMAPFKIEVDFNDNVKPRMLDLANQSITLKDGTQITLDLSVLWSIFDLKTFVCEVEDADTALGGIMGIAQEHLFQYRWEELVEFRSRAAENKRFNNLPQALRTEFNKFTEDFGVSIKEVFINTLSRTSLEQGVIRILGYDSRA